MTDRYRTVFINGWWPLLISILIWLIFLPLFQKGTFIDGMLYKTVAFNKAADLSSFWKMHFTATSMQDFCEQPPLYFYLLGSVYRVFGTGLYVDRSFTLILLLSLFFVIGRTLKKLTASNLSLFPAIILLLSIPVFCWSYVNQVIEPMVCLFTVMGILFYIRWYQKRQFYDVILFMSVIILAFITKGFQSCFFVVLPFVHQLLIKDVKGLFIYLTTAFGFIGVFVLLFIYHEPALHWFKCYYESRLVLTMNNTGATTSNHTEIIWRFFTELIPVFIFGLILFFYLRTRHKIQLNDLVSGFGKKPLAIALLITSFAGSLPFALSLVQRGFYLLPAFVCFVMALTIAWDNYWLLLVNELRVAGQKTWFRIATAVILGFSLSWAVRHIGDYKRDAALHHDVDVMITELPAGTKVRITEELWNYVSLHALLKTKNNNSLETDAGSEWMITYKDHGSQDSLYTKLELNTTELDLWQLK